MPDELTFAVGSLTSHGARLVPENPEDFDAVVLTAEASRPRRVPALTQEMFGAFSQLSQPLYLSEKPLVALTLGGAKFPHCVKDLAQRLAFSGNGGMQMAAIIGANVFHQIEDYLAAGCQLWNHKTEQPFEELPGEIVLATLELGAEPIAEAIEQSARIVVTQATSEAEMIAGISAGLAGRPSPTASARELHDWLAKQSVDRSKYDLDATHLMHQGIKRFCVCVDTMPEARQRERQTASLSIVYRSGFAAIATLRFSPETNRDLSLEFVNTMLDALASRGVTDYECELIPSINTNQASPTLAVIKLRHDDRATIHSAARRIRQAVELASDGRGPTLVQPPMLSANYETWPTSIPTSLVECRVDVRSVREWSEI